MLALTFSSATLDGAGRVVLAVTLFFPATCHGHSWGALPPIFSPVLNHGGREKEGRKDRSAKSQNWQMTVQGSGYLGEFPPVSASKGSRVEQPGPHTPATLRMTTGSLVSMTEPRSHDVPSTTTRLLWLLQQLGCLLHPMRAR